jgi:hypothetical protein
MLRKGLAGILGYRYFGLASAVIKAAFLEKIVPRRVF